MKEGLDPRFALYLSYRAVLIDYASYLLGSREGAEDLVQEAFIKFIPSGGSRTPTARPRSYLFRIVHNLAVDVLRRKRLENLRSAHNAPVWAGSQAAATPEETVLYHESERRAMDIIAGLPEKQRVALEMHRFGGYSVEEVAAHLGVSVPTVYRLIQAAVATVTIRLEQDSGGRE
ncbi:RNA polymerase sigma factor [Bradyrhizobium cenepequi]|uniref:RNA polymerase sigma factor n=1 Tax=Bradyrhizobium cenepequi TaxID=2821403 RepID=UPI001CE2E55E|nr:sigma-70 family RNA polymerase sigma factor [Bradyrhizobium cenepequi]MCA6110826.1 sigma-70 family RNA polymerase sigma factor [Bradyrhizobium cenepequi]